MNDSSSAPKEPDHKEPEESKSKDSKPSSNSDQRTPAEWVTFGIALSLLATLVGLVVAAWIDPHQQQPPQIEAAQEGIIREAAGQFYVPFTVTNTGGKTAESVQVIAELEINGEVVESGEQQIDFLSSGEAEAGAFIFSQDPTQGTVKLRAASYKLP